MSLDALQKLRQQTVEELMLELARITQALTRSEDQCRTLEARIQLDSIAYQRQTEQGLTIEALMEWQGRLDSQQSYLQQLRRDIHETAVAWQETSARLVEANREYKLVDRVVEQRRMAQRAEVVRRDQRVTDEAAARSYRAEGMSGT